MAASEQRGSGGGFGAERERLWRQHQDREGASVLATSGQRGSGGGVGAERERRRRRGREGASTLAASGQRGFVSDGVVGAKSRGFEFRRDRAFVGPVANVVPCLFIYQNED